MNNNALNIMTWNTGMTEWSNLSDTKNVYTQIVDFLKHFLENENPVVVLQQIPFKQKLDGKWIKHPLFIQFCKDFSNYKLYYNDKFNNGYIIMMTVIITLDNNTTTSCNNTIYPNSIATNREYAIICNGFSILGIHAANADKNKPYLESLNGAADIILGDFNSGNYISSENRTTFNNLLKEHICICNTPTRIDPYTLRKTCIDHIFVRDCLITKCSNLIVHENIQLSDHFPITFKIL